MFIRCVLAAWFLCFFAHAEIGYFMPPITLSQSGSGRAAINKASEYHLLNPASIAHLGKASGAVHFMGDTSDPYWGLSVVENNRMPIGISFLKHHASDKQILVLSLAGFVVPGWGLGFSLKRLAGFEKTAWHIRSGVLIKPSGSNKLSLGATWEHIFSPQPAFYIYEQIGAGLAYQVNQWLHLQVDVISDLSSNSKAMELASWKKNLHFAGGMETVFSQFLVLRTGAVWYIDSDTIVYSGGVGVRGKTIGVDYSFSLSAEKWVYAWNVHASF